MGCNQKHATEPPPRQLSQQAKPLRTSIQGVSKEIPRYVVRHKSCLTRFYAGNNDSEQLDLNYQNQNELLVRFWVPTSKQSTRNSHQPCIQNEVGTEAVVCTRTT